MTPETETLSDEGMANALRDAANGIDAALSLVLRNAGPWVDKAYSLEKLTAIRAELEALAESLLEAGMIEEPEQPTPTA